MKKFTLAIMITMFSALCFAQSLELQTISSGGTDLTGPNGNKMNVIIGEVAVERLESNGVVLTQGFNQIFDFSTAVTDDGETFTLTVFPNPTASQLNIKGGPEGDFQLTIFDLKGRAIDSRPYPGNRLEMNLSHLSSGQYFIRVSEKGKTIDQLRFQKL